MEKAGGDISAKETFLVDVNRQANANDAKEEDHQIQGQEVCNVGGQQSSDEPVLTFRHLLYFKDFDLKNRIEIFECFLWSLKRFVCLI